MNVGNDLLVCYKVRSVNLDNKLNVYYNLQRRVTLDNKMMVYHNLKGSISEGFELPDGVVIITDEVRSVQFDNLLMVHNLQGQVGGCDYV